MTAPATTTPAAPAAALLVERLGIESGSGTTARRILDDVSFTLAAGSSVGLVGRSGAGKSTVGNALLGLLPRGLRPTPGSTMRLGDDDLLALDAEAMRSVRGRRLSMVFQEPLTALDPTQRVGAQLVEALRTHGLADGPAATESAVEMLSRVGIGDARAAARRYPHELSGGMRQRLLLAMALLLEPEVLIADEPTTALDPTLQAQILDLLDALRERSRTALLLISHDLAVVGERCERVLVLDEGRIVEDGDAASVVGARLVRPRPPAAEAVERNLAEAERKPLLDVRDLAVAFVAPQGPRRRVGGVVRAVDGVSLSLGRGECLGLVGESGCGKTTLARAILRLTPVTGGSVRFAGEEITVLDGERLRRLRRRMQLVPQDAGASLTPQRTVGELVREGLEVHGVAEGAAAEHRMLAVLDEVGLAASFAARRPGELSSGERQRVAIARALAPAPDLLVCDEPVAAVDAEVRDQILDLLDRLRRRHGLALLFISHDLDAVRRLASRVAVMYLGRVVERSESPAALEVPWMPYTVALRSAMPTGDPAARAARIVLRGEFPSPLHPPAGCAFHPRCPHPGRDAACQVTRPELVELAPGRWVACPKVSR
ncbi:MAG: ABC transporter ATP-binding protein [Gemmatimonadaceae bacterium]